MLGNLSESGAAYDGSRNRQESQGSNELNGYPVFHDQGDWVVVDGTTGEVESGTFSVDTCAAKQAGDWLEWEVLLNLSSEKALALSEDDGGYGDTSLAYTPAGEVYRLWGVEGDPRGESARQVHAFITERAKSGIPANQLDSEAQDFIRNVRKGVGELKAVSYPQLE